MSGEPRGTGRWSKGSARSLPLIQWPEADRLGWERPASLGSGSLAADLPAISPR